MTAEKRLKDLEEKLKDIKTWCLDRNADIESDPRYEAEPKNIDTTGDLALIQVSMVAEHEAYRRIAVRC